MLSLMASRSRRGHSSVPEIAATTSAEPAIGAPRTPPDRFQSGTIAPQAGRDGAIRPCRQRGRRQGGCGQLDRQTVERDGAVFPTVARRATGTSRRSAARYPAAAGGRPRRCPTGNAGFANLIRLRSASNRASEPAEASSRPARRPRDFAGQGHEGVAGGLLGEAHGQAGPRSACQAVNRTPDRWRAGEAKPKREIPRTAVGAMEIEHRPQGVSVYQGASDERGRPCRR